MTSTSEQQHTSQQVTQPRRHGPATSRIWCTPSKAPGGTSRFHFTRRQTLCFFDLPLEIRERVYTLHLQQQRDLLPRRPRLSASAPQHVIYPWNVLPGDVRRLAWSAAARTEMHAVLLRNATLFTCFDFLSARAPTPALSQFARHLVDISSICSLPNDGAAIDELAHRLAAGPKLKALEIILRSSSRGLCDCRVVVGGYYERILEPLRRLRAEYVQFRFDDAIDYCRERDELLWEVYRLMHVGGGSYGRLVAFVLELEKDMQG